MTTEGLNQFLDNRVVDGEKTPEASSVLARLIRIGVDKSVADSRRLNEAPRPASLKW